MIILLYLPGCQVSHLWVRQGSFPPESEDVFFYKYFLKFSWDIRTSHVVQKSIPILAGSSSGFFILHRGARDSKLLWLAMNKWKFQKI